MFQASLSLFHQDSYNHRKNSDCCMGQMYDKLWLMVILIRENATTCHQPNHLNVKLEILLDRVKWLNISNRKECKLSLGVIQKLKNKSNFIYLFYFNVFQNLRLQLITWKHGYIFFELDSIWLGGKILFFGSNLETQNLKFEDLLN